MSAPQPVNASLISSADLYLANAAGKLEDLESQDLSAEAREVVELTHNALLELTRWAHQVNNALGTLDSVAVGDVPTA